MSVRLRDELETIAGEMPPARLADDVWQRGRRLRRRSRLVAAGAALVTVVLVTLLVPVGQRLVAVPIDAPGDGGDSVPARVYLPWPVQATVEDAPAGPAAVVFQTRTGGVVVARNGAYRRISLPEAALLSPDGRYVATGKKIIDLANGNTYPHDAGDPLAWSADGRLLIANRIRSLLLVSPAGLRRFLPLSGTVRGAAAFSPDGTKAAVRTDDGLASVNLADGSRNWKVTLPDAVIVAGPAAWSTDGRRIAVVDTTGGARLRYLDAQTGTAVDGPTVELPDATARLIGTRPDGELVVTVTRPHAMVVLVRPDGGQQVLLDPPTEVRSIDVPRDLAETGRFNGPASRPVPWPMSWYSSFLLAVMLALAVPWRRLVWRYVLHRPPPPRRFRPASRILRGTGDSRTG